MSMILGQSFFSSLSFVVVVFSRTMDKAEEDWTENEGATKALENKGSTATAISRNSIMVNQMELYGRGMLE